MQEFIRSFWYFLCRYIFIVLPDRVFMQILWFVNCKRLGYEWYWLNLNNPRSFNERLNYLKLNYKFPEGPMLADKVAVRKYIEDNIGSEYLVPSLGSSRNPDLISFDELPESFVIKANHGSGWNIICKNKSDLDWEQAKNSLKKWLSMNEWYLSREWQYKPIIPELLIEEMLEYDIYDYKFFCTYGDIHYIQVDIDRFSGHKRNFYDCDWNLQNFGINYPISERDITRPAQFDLMLNIAQKLSTELKFARIDLYEHHGKVYFGEITLFPGGGAEPFLSKGSDFKVGELIKI